MNLTERIQEIEKHLAEIDKQPAEIPNTEIHYLDIECETHGAYQARKRVSTSGLKLASRPSPCPKCLLEELEKLRTEKQQSDERGKKRLIEKLLAELNIPERFIP